MLIFWWTGKGYLTPVVVFAVFCAFGIVLSMTGTLIGDTPVYWGFAAIAAGMADWFVGRRVNAKAIASVRSIHFRHKLLYRARHRFMSLPLELWSVPLVLGGMAAVIYGWAGPT